MTLKDKIIIDLNDIKNPSLLNQIFDFIQTVKEGSKSSEESNRDEVLKFAGKIDDDAAMEITSIINSEFNQIEGDW